MKIRCAPVFAARFAAQRDPTVISKQFDGWLSTVERVVVGWDGSRWRGHGILDGELRLINYN